MSFMDIRFKFINLAPQTVATERFNYHNTDMSQFPHHFIMIFFFLRTHSLVSHRRIIVNPVMLLETVDL